ncbi:MAG: hypothetical protein WAT19_14830 [Ferruginibacter sp.]
MKKTIPITLALLCLLLVNSFANTPADEPKGTNGKCYVQYNDGTVKEFGSLELVTGFFKTPHLLADGNTVVKAHEIKAYYDSKGRYAVSTKNFSDNKKTGKVAADALQGFALRVAKGKINLYSVKYYNGRNTVNKFFLQDGDKGAIVPYTTELFNSLVKNDTEVSGFCQGKLDAKDAAKCLLAAVEMYNRNAEALTIN